jgi:hypothetical protein
MIATAIQSSERGEWLLFVCYLGRVLLQHGGPAYGLVNETIAGREETDTFHQFVPDQMKYFSDLRPRYTAMSADCYVLFPASASARAWLHPGAVMAITRVTTASSLADVLEQSDRSQMAKMAKLDMHARYPSPFQLRFPPFLFFCDSTYLQDVFGHTHSTRLYPPLEKASSTSGPVPSILLGRKFDEFDFSE